MTRETIVRFTSCLVSLKHQIERIFARAEQRYRADDIAVLIVLDGGAPGC
jgi:hypothetical protein